MRKFDRAGAPTTLCPDSPRMRRGRKCAQRKIHVMVVPCACMLATSEDTPQHCRFRSIPRYRATLFAAHLGRSGGFGHPAGAQRPEERKLRGQDAGRLECAPEIPRAGRPAEHD